jgi:hypothetical protein
MSAGIFLCALQSRRFLEIIYRARSQRSAAIEMITVLPARPSVRRLVANHVLIGLPEADSH